MISPLNPENEQINPSLGKVQNINPSLGAKQLVPRLPAADALVLNQFSRLTSSGALKLTRTSCGATCSTS
jgi:hypothetical protein